jgi:hypothetical protein
MAVNAKKKGNRGERQARDFWKGWTGLEFERVPQSGGLRWKKADNISGDLTCTEPNYIFPYSIEVKFPKEIKFEHLLYSVKSDIIKYWAQAVEDAVRSVKIPLLMMRYNGLPKGMFFIVMYGDYGRFMIDHGLRIPQPHMVLKSPNYLVIFTTNELAKLDYKKFYKIGRRWQKDRLNG